MRGAFDPRKLQSQLDELNKIAEDPTLWDNKEKAQKILKEKSLIEEKLNKFNNLKNLLSDNLSYLELAEIENDSQLLNDVENNLNSLKKLSDNFEIECLFSAENDINNCFVDINAGAGGTDRRRTVAGPCRARGAGA